MWVVTGTFAKLMPQSFASPEACLHQVMIQYSLVLCSPLIRNTECPNFRYLLILKCRTNSQLIEYRTEYLLKNFKNARLSQQNQ